MAFSQLLCLDNNHENPRINEFKPEFLYCEDQRLALEALLQDGREGYLKILEARGLRGFLSDPELEGLASSVEPYDPDMELFPENVEDGESPLSLQYWPELSDMSIPQMDLSWPDCESYRGVTRTTAYSQPPMEGQPHIKEVVRKMIAQAQKVIAVVMDVFTDVDIFRDLLDAGFKRKVSVYILLEHTTLPHFLSMCQRANMHAGHLKHLRVRTTGGLDFYTRSSSRVQGRMGHRFMFIDGDKAVSGSYSFTWTSSRMDRNLITAVTGQAVDAFDRLFQILYQTSRLVDLRKVAMEPEPEREYLPQPVIVAPLSAALARKLYNPKYALVLGDSTNGREPSAVKSNPKKTDSQEDTKTKKRRRATKEATEKDPPIHPGLNLEKACLMFYLPTWPEPDPPSDVIGFINIRDPNRPNQVHLQRHEMFEISQAIRFSSPISIPKEILPEVAKPRQVGRKCEEINELKPSPNKTKAQVSVVERAQPAEQNKPAADIKMKAEAPEQISPASGRTCEADNYTKRPENTDNKLHPSRHTNTEAVLNTHPPPQSSKVSTPDNPVLNPLPGSNTKTSSNTQETQLSPTVDPNTEQTTRTKTQPKCTDSHTEPQNLEMTPNIQIPNYKSHMSPSSTSTVCSQSVCSTSLSENNLVSISASMNTSVPLSPNSPPLTSSSSTLSSHIPLSSPLTSARPIPKPRTVQLVIKGDVTSNGQKVQEFSIIKRSQTSTAPMSRVEPAAAETQHETVPELNNNDGTKAGELKDSDIIRNIEEAPQQKISQEAKNEEIDGLQVGRAEMHLLAGTNLDALSDCLTCDAPEAEGVNIQEIIPKDFEPTDCKSAPLFTPTVQTGTNATDGTPAGLLFAEDPSEKNVQNAEELNSNSNSEKAEKDIDALDTVNSCHTQTQVPKDTAGDCTHTPDTHKTMQGQPSFKHRTCTDSLPNATIHNAHNTDTPKKNLCLNFSGKNMSDLSVSPDRELLPALGRTPTPEGFLSHTLCPDSQIQRTAPLSNSSDLQSPTSDLSDENVSLRTDSALSTTSEEYFECSDSPLQESVPCRAALCNHLMKEDQVGFTHSNSTTLITIPTFIGYNPFAATSVFSDSCSLSSNEVYGKELDEKSSSDTEVDSLGSQRRDRPEVTGVTDHFKEVEKLRDAADRNKEVQLKAPERKTVLNQSAERCVDGQVTRNQSRNEEEDPKQLCAEDPKPHEGPHVGARPDKRKAAGKGDTKSSGLEKRGRRLSSAETDGMKPSPPPVRPLRQQDGGTSSPSRPRRPSRPLSGDGPAGGGQLNQPETKELCTGLQVLDTSSSTRKPPARPPPPVAAGNAGSAGSRKPLETPGSRQNLQCRVKAVHTTNQHPNPRPQTPNMLGKLHPHPQIQTVSAPVAPCQEEEKSPLNFSLSRLYSLKSLKDKIVKVPVASKRDSSSSAAQRHKSTS